MGRGRLGGWVWGWRGKRLLPLPSLALAASTRDAGTRCPSRRNVPGPAGEEVVTRESFISIGWRLIPYWLNNWEQVGACGVTTVWFGMLCWGMWCGSTG